MSMILVYSLESYPTGGHQDADGLTVFDGKNTQLVTIIVHAPRLVAQINSTAIVSALNT